jgi:hypothetical protein
LIAEAQLFEVGLAMRLSTGVDPQYFFSKLSYLTFTFIHWLFLIFPSIFIPTGKDIPWQCKSQSFHESGLKL